MSELSVQQKKQLSVYLKSHPKVSREQAVKILFSTSAKINTKSQNEGLEVEHTRTTAAPKKKGGKYNVTGDSKKQGAQLASDLHKQIEGASLNSKTIALLKQIKPENVVSVLDQYSKITGGKETLSQAVDNEWGLDITTIKQYICPALVRLAKDKGVTGIYFGDYMKINNIDDLNNWVDNAKNKLKAALNIHPEETTVLNKKYKIPEYKPVKVDDIVNDYYDSQNYQYGNSLGKSLYNQIQGISNPMRTVRLLNYVDFENIGTVMQAYEECSGGKQNLIDDMAGEYGLTTDNLRKFGQQLLDYGIKNGINLNNYQAKIDNAKDKKALQTVLTQMYNVIKSHKSSTTKTSNPSMRKYLDQFGRYCISRKFKNETGITLEEAILEDSSITTKEKIDKIRNTFTLLVNYAKKMKIDVSDIIKDVDIDWQALNNDNDFEKYIPLCSTTIRRLSARIYSKGEVIQHPANGKIDNNFSQGMTGDCWLLASIAGIARKPKGLKILNDSVKVNNDGSVTVHLKGPDKTYTISKAELNNANELSTGDGDVRAIEIAVNRYMRENYKNGYGEKASLESNHEAYAYYLLTGRIGQVSSHISKYMIDTFNSSDKITCVSSHGNKQKISVSSTNPKSKSAILTTRHAYTVTHVDKNYVYLINPWDTSNELKVDRKTFTSFFTEMESFTL